ncbi:hypothetical protein [Bartonella jaculi]|uniref:Uncharacterized protein n=1 Tax=Bartonella jaculi TaxID=686226 RepID=A0ABP9NA76_9HYPH
MKKQELRKQGSIVCDEEIIFEAEGMKHCPDIVYIKDGELAVADRSID